MPISLTCGGCGRAFKVPDHAAGRKGRCPDCGHVVRIPGPAASGPEPEPAGAPAARKGPATAAPARTTNGLGVASLVLGVLALLIAWVPLLGLLAWPLGGLGLLLGAVGLVLAARNGRWGKGTAVAGMVTSGAAVLIALGVTFFTSRVLQEVADRARVDAEHVRVDAPSAISPEGSEVSIAPAAAPDGPVTGRDRNGDGVPRVDEAPPVRGRPVAQRVFTAADDFVVEVWHNGQRVPDAQRQLVGENYGATAEKIEVEVREGDWLVFLVANNRLRWDGVCYFGAAGVNGGDGEQSVAFASDPSDGRWSSCDDPAKAPAFIARPGYLADQAAAAPEKPWPGGDGEMKARVPGWAGKPVWGRERVTWLKYVARPGDADRAAKAAAEAKAARAAAPPLKAEAPAPKPEGEAAATPAVTLTPKATLTGHPALVYRVAVSPDGRRAVSGSAPDFSGDGGKGNETLIVWDLADRGKTRGVIPIEASVTGLAITPDSRSVVVAVGNGLSAYDLKTGRLMATLAGPPRTSALSAAVSPDGKLAAAGYMSHEVLVWNVRTRKILHTFKGHTSGVIALAFSPDGKQLASGGQDHAVRLWDASAGKPLRTLDTEKADSPVTCVAYAPTGGRLAAVLSGDAPRFWDAASGGPQPFALKVDDPLAFHAVAFSRDGRRLATASLEPRSMKGAVALWDAATGRRLAQEVDPDGLVNDVAFTPDGKGLVSGGGRTVKLWDVGP